jgi:type I restriction-modification system DNA methylase subunit
MAPRIDKITKEFFEQYKSLFEKIKIELANLIGLDARVRTEFKDKSIEIDDFAKKLLGQIVFLYFLQKKGWLGVERDAAWGTGDKNYLRYLFEGREHLGRQQGKAKKQTVNFFNDILEHLFYDALATDRTPNHYYGRFDCRIPFLNGGLFEPLQDYSWESVDILLPDELFSNNDPTKDGDPGTGILDVFDRYNFTVNEAEPSETEVAVDPEMLGKVFENLLPENLRYKGGTYYTPRVIVNYLCQQSIINYLASRLTGKVSRDDIEALIILGEALREFEANQRKNEETRLPEAVRKHAQEIDRLLAGITVCDPAIGSGAFPVGMMQEIVRARSTLAYVEGMPARTAYDLKRHAIENSLYGADIDPGAIEIVRLRLWLSLVVDEDDFERIKPLSNLDYKIMQGNSLLEEFVEVFQDKGGFDVVIGNPPYIRIQEIQASAPDTVEYYKRRYAAAGKGNYDLYVIFVERGLSLLNKSGFLSYILPHKFFNAQYGAPLRKLIADGRHLQHVIHFGDQQIFPSATNYTCLLFLSKQPVAQCRFVRVKDFEAWSMARTGQEGEIASDCISSDEWNFAIGSEAALFEKLSRMPTKLEDVAERMAQGIRTSANEVYVLNIVKTDGELITAYSQALERDVILERDAVSLFLQGREIKPFQIFPSGKVVVIPYRTDGGVTTLIKEQELKTDLPNTFAYLFENKSHLQERENGKMKGSNWYGFVYPKNIDVMKCSKILVPDIADRASFAIDEEGQYAFTSGYGITLKDDVGESPRYILGLLNSKLLDFYWKKISTPLRGGFFRYFTQFIKQLPIRTINFSDPLEVKQHQLMVTLVDYILFLKASMANMADIAESDSPAQLIVNYFGQLIDALVYELYLPDEIHAAGRQFFAPLITERLPALDEIKGDKLEALRQIFERLYDRNHVIRKNIFLLDTIESVRIIEGKT